MKSISILQVDLFQNCISKSRERKGLMKSTKEFWSKKHFDGNSGSQYSDHWLISRTHHARGKPKWTGSEFIILDRRKFQFLFLLLPKDILQLAIVKNYKSHLRVFV